VTAAVAAGNPNLPTGTLWGPTRLHGPCRRFDLERAGIPQARGDVPERRAGPAARRGAGARRRAGPRNASWYDGKRAVILAIQRQPGTNTVQVADGVKATVASLASLLPASVEVNTLYDRSVSIRQSVNDVQVTCSSR